MCNSGSVVIFSSEYSVAYRQAVKFVTHRRSVAKRGGCFQQRLFVSVFVCTITSEQLNVGRSNLAVRCSVQKSRPSLKVKRQGHQGQRMKNC